MRFQETRSTSIDTDEVVQGMTTYKCWYCNKVVDKFNDVISHLVENHSNNEIKYIRQENNRFQTLNFNIIPDMCREQGRVITVNNESEKIHISKSHVIPKESPFKKIIKVAENAIDNDCLEYDNSEEHHASNTTDLDGEKECKEIISLLPCVIEELKRSGSIEEYVLFHRLINDGKFPLNNIAYLLFMDVVRWFGIEGSTSSMRYSENVKLFWKTGLKLFHGRFLRFMSGPKNIGQVVQGVSDLGQCTSENSKVNFIVPHKNVLQEEKKFVNAANPGILDEMLETISKFTENAKTFKLCVDGKKINPTSKGEIDLWGYENPPTHEERDRRLMHEIAHLEEFKELIAKQISFGHVEIETCTSEQKQKLLKSCRSVVTLLSMRLRDIRQLKVKKDLFLRKLTDRCESDWRNSQYAMVISSIKTTIYRIENAVDELLACIDAMCNCAAILCDVNECYSSKTVVPLFSQSNLVCLGGNGTVDQPFLIKQRSETWHELRKTCIVTGSTIHKAVGLDSLKRQKEFLNEKTGQSSPKEVAANVQKLFDHGTLNEPNALATFVSKFLPAFLPSSSLFEEGCYVTTKNNETLLIVSPDGSVRNKSNESDIQFGVEIKCPYPGKIHTTPMHYDLPRYYVPQVLSEMYCLGVNTLFFISYAEESTTVHEVYFDEMLWQDIMVEIETVNKCRNPKKLSPNLPNLKGRIQEFCKSNVRFIAEIPSCKADLCDHSTQNCSRIYHTPALTAGKSHGFLLRKLEKMCLKSEQQIKDCHSINVQRASEVLVFLVADLDRLYKPEAPHAFPIAYAFKGYSMKTDVMSKMIKDVLHALFLKGMYTPVISYDGQWAKLAFQASNAEPLTLLELQKKLYNDVKNRNVGELTNKIFQCCVTKVITLADVQEKLYYEKGSNGIWIGLQSNRKFLTMSTHNISLIQEMQRQKVRSKHKSDEEGLCIDDILSDLPPDVLSTIDNETAESLSAIAETGITACDSQPMDDVHVCTSVDGIMFTDTPSVDFMACTTTDGEATYSEMTCMNDGIQEPEIEMISNETQDQVNLTLQGSHTAVINDENLATILAELQNNTKWSEKWIKMSSEEFNKVMKTESSMKSHMTKAELLFCAEIFNGSTGRSTIRLCKSWNKQKIVSLLHEACTSHTLSEEPSNKIKKKNPSSLKVSCKRVIKSLPKRILNAIIAENEFRAAVNAWRKNSPFGTPTSINGIGDIVWFSKPEYNNETMAYIFSLLDPHHLITNCRVKVCKDGFRDRGIDKYAWYNVAKSNTTNLKISHVEDLIDKQSDSIAKETFSLEVESEMRKLGYLEEAIFSRLIREFYEAEDDPGISCIDRCTRRLNLCDWLLKDVNFGCFPPYGSHIKGIPQVMFQGLLTNIERRIQLFPFIKSGCYNVRSLGSLEAENFFGEFQDIDPKGSGVIKAEDIPAALEIACQLNHTRLDPSRPFHMSLTKAKVYPTHLLMTGTEMEIDDRYIYPVFVNQICPQDHMFDTRVRAKRKARRKIATVAGPDEAARGVAPVRQHHKCDESKIFPHKRLGIDIK